jgi:hypothetical protein
MGALSFRLGLLDIFAFHDVLGSAASFLLAIALFNLSFVNGAGSRLLQLSASIITVLLAAIAVALSIRGLRH